MPYLYAGLMILIIFIFLNLFIKVSLYAVYNSSDGQVKVQISVFDLIHREQSFPAGGMQFVISKITAARNSRPSPIKLPLNQSLKIISVFFKHLYIQEFKWYTTIGTGDAMYTALSSGSMWAIKGIIISALTCLSTAKTVMVNVEPDFDDQRVYSDLSCIFKLRMAHIMLIVIHIICFKIRRYINGFTTAGKPQPSH
ncbi:putative secreted protein [hydrocarbon metagenome]|uniref:Putative secreted protein n=1 Tax=hydrocarbon metagenome TaxID=938273 RepID=A0A0W8E623_9ZZZZ